MSKKVHNLEEFRIWVRVRMVYQETSQNKMARKFNVPAARISEALNGKPSGKKYILLIIKELGGNPEDFESILKAV